MSTFIYQPSYNSSLSREPKVLEARFGDGYAQRAADGINNNPQIWTLTFENISLVDADAIESFLSTAGGVTPFDWTPPGKPSARFVCKQWSRTYGAPGSYNMNMTFEQDFAP